MSGVGRHEVLRQKSTSLLEHLDIPHRQVSVVGIADLLRQQAPNGWQYREEMSARELGRTALEVQWTSERYGRNARNGIRYQSGVDHGSARPARANCRALLQTRY